MEKIRHQFILLTVGNWPLDDDLYLFEKTGNFIVIHDNFRYVFLKNRKDFWFIYTG
jgi:hypothetical protein